MDERAKKKLAFQDYTRGHVRVASQCIRWHAFRTSGKRCVPATVLDRFVLSAILSFGARRGLCRTLRDHGWRGCEHPISFLPISFVLWMTLARPWSLHCSEVVSVPYQIWHLSAAVFAQKMGRQISKFTDRAEVQMQTWRNISPEDWNKILFDRFHPFFSYFRLSRPVQTGTAPYFWRIPGSMGYACSIDNVAVFIIGGGNQSLRPGIVHM